jgi:hypothetical protein
MKFFPYHMMKVKSYPYPSYRIQYGSCKRSKRWHLPPYIRVYSTQTPYLTVPRKLFSYFFNLQHRAYRYVKKQSTIQFFFLLLVDIFKLKLAPRWCYSGFTFKLTIKYSGRDRLIMGYFINLDNEFLNKY